MIYGVITPSFRTLHVVMLHMARSTIATSSFPLWVHVVLSFLFYVILTIFALLIIKEESAPDRHQAGDIPGFGN